MKNGALKLAQKTGAPIVPVHWFSPQKSFISLPSWDKMKVPFGKCDIINVYGEPIYVKENYTDEEFNAVKEEIKKQLLELEEKAPKVYIEAQEKDLWNK